jgi:hypothetical protein
MERGKEEREREGERERETLYPLPMEARVMLPWQFLARRLLLCAGDEKAGRAQTPSVQGMGGKERTVPLTIRT